MTEQQPPAPTPEPIVVDLHSSSSPYNVSGRDGYQFAHIAYSPFRPRTGRMKHNADPLMGVSIGWEYLLRDVSPEQAAQLDSWLGQAAQDLARQLGARVAQMTGRPLMVHDDTNPEETE